MFCKMLRGHRLPGARAREEFELGNQQPKIPQLPKLTFEDLGGV
jgi:hypothetical protein